MTNFSFIRCRFALVKILAPARKVQDTQAVRAKTRTKMFYKLQVWYKESTLQKPLQVAEGQEIGNPSAFARHRQAVEDSQHEIKVCLRGYKILFKLVYLPESCMQIISDSAHPPYCTHKLISLVCLSKARILKCKSFFFFGGT